MADITDNCPTTLLVPFTVTVNTSGSVPSPVASHSDATTNGGWTRISEFTFNAQLTGTAVSLQDYLPEKVSSTTAVWDFGDGYSLSGGETTIATHKYNIPGVYTVTMFFYDINGTAYLNTFTKTISVYNYIQTNVNLTNEDVNAVSARSVTAGSKDDTFMFGVSSSWQDIPDDEQFTMYLTASGSKAKPYDTKNKYAHLIPYNAFYNTTDGDLIDNINGLQFKLNNRYYTINPYTDTVESIVDDRVDHFKNAGFKTYLLGATVDNLSGWRDYDTSTTSVTSLTTRGYSESPVDKPTFIYYDDIPNIRPGVRLLFKLDTSKHKIKNFYVDEIDSDINTSNRNFLETNQSGVILRKGGITTIGYPIMVLHPVPRRFSFTSTGMKEMSAIDYKRQGDKFQVFISLADKKLNPLKLYPKFLKVEPTDLDSLNTDYTFRSTWVSGSNTISTNISSIKTDKFPYNTTTSNTELSSFVYLNIDPLSAGTWTLNVTGRVPGLSSSSLSGFGKSIAYGTGCVGEGCVGEGCVGIGTLSANLIVGSYTFTVSPSTNDTEIYKINEDIDYSQTIKSYRFQSFLHEYDKLFDGVFTSFVGEASSSPTVFGKTIFEKIANFVANNNDIDYCNIDNLQSFYDLFNEDIDIILPTPPPGLKRLYDLFSIKISKLLGDYERYSESFDTSFYTSSADSRNIDFNNPITTSTYTVTTGANFVARQKFNNEFILIKPQNVCSKSVSGANTDILSTYPLSAYNEYSNWGWPLDTSVSGASGLASFYEFYPYTTYDTTSSTENIKNNIIDFHNPYTTITRSSSSLSANWDNAGGIIYKNIDYQIRKGLNI